MRLLLVLTLLHGLAPGLGELAESVVHYVAEGHLAHSAADHGDLGCQGEEHGCGTTDHHCACCASQPVAISSAPPVLAGSPSGPGPVIRQPALASLHAPAPPLRPPIAS